MCAFAMLCTWDCKCRFDIFLIYNLIGVKEHVTKETISEINYFFKEQKNECNTIFSKRIEKYIVIIISILINIIISILKLEIIIKFPWGRYSNIFNYILKIIK